MMALDLSSLATIQDRLALLLPDGVAVVCTDPRRDVADEDVFAVEAAAVARAVPKRRNEFFAGRIAAHRAMTELGRLPAPVPMASDRAPVWPEGLVGSISHCPQACAAIAAEAAGFRSLGIDLETDADLPEELLPLVCLPEERRWLDTLPGEAQGRAARLIFSAKECVYKLQYPLTQQMLDFSDVSIRVDMDTEGFMARLPAGLAPFGHNVALRGRFGCEAGILFCIMFVVQ